VATFSYDFESDSVGSVPSGWSFLCQTGTGGTGNVFEALGDKYWRLIPQSAQRIEYINDDTGSSSDVIVTGEFSRNISNTFVRIWIRHSGDSGASDGDGYLLYIGGSSITVYTVTNGSVINTIGTASKTYSIATKYNFRFEATGTTIRAWAGTGAWPGTWDVSNTESTYSSGRVVIGSYYTTYFDDISITSDDGTEIETSEPGALTIAGFNATLTASFPTDITAGVGALEIAALNPRLPVYATTGAVVIAGLGATVTATQPQYSTLNFKFKDADGVVKSYEIGRRPSVREISGSDFANVNDDIVLCDATTGALNLRLPQASGRSGFIYRIKKTDASANAVTVLANAAETIDGAASVVLSSQNDFVVVVSDDSSWWVVGS
jgi:hypothetical protein